MKCHEIRFDNENVMFVQDESLAKDIQTAVILAGEHCSIRTADISQPMVQLLFNQFRASALNPTTEQVISADKQE